MSTPSSRKSVVQLREILALLSAAVEDIASEWELSSNEDYPRGENKLSDATKSHTEYDAVKTVLAAVGSLESLIVDPYVRLITLSASYTIARALHIAAEINVAELLEQGGDDGVHASILARSTGIEENKLCRIMRCLTSHHIFQEVREDRFANNHISYTLVGDVPFRSYILMKGRTQYAASDYLPSILMDETLGRSYKPTETALQRALGTKLSAFDWMNQLVPASRTNWRPAHEIKQDREDDILASSESSSRESNLKEELVPRPDKELFQLAMAGLGRGTEQYYVHDFPWNELGSGTVVDVGGGIGSFCTQLYHAYPELNLIIQDSGPMIEQAVAVWEKNNPEAVSQGKVKLTAHDFFVKNPVVGADAYWLRHIIHDWPDREAIAILSRIAESMSSGSRALIADVVVNTTLGCEEIKSAPKPLLANYGQAVSQPHMMDITMMMMVNGKERTPSEFRGIISAAGLIIVKVWECRGPLSIIECRLR